MKLISERKALRKLKVIKDELKADVAERFEHRAKSCESCETPGACCLDAHFVNVHVSRLEAKAIKAVLGSLTVEKRNQVYGKIVSAIERYGLTSDSGSFDRTYACPLFEPGIGCLVHDEGKPVPSNP